MMTSRIRCDHQSMNRGKTPPKMELPSRAVLKFREMRIGPIANKKIIQKNQVRLSSK